MYDLYSMVAFWSAKHNSTLSEWLNHLNLLTALLWCMQTAEQFHRHAEGQTKRGVFTGKERYPYLTRLINIGYTPHAPCVECYPRTGNARGVRV